MLAESLTPGDLLDPATPLAPIARRELMDEIHALMDSELIGCA